MYVFFVYKKMCDKQEGNPDTPKSKAYIKGIIWSPLLLFKKRKKM